MQSQTGAKTPVKDESSPALVLPLKKAYYSLHPVKHMCVCVYIISCFTVDILYDLILFSFGFLWFNDSRRSLFDVVSLPVCLEIPLSSTECHSFILYVHHLSED